MLSLVFTIVGCLRPSLGEEIAAPWLSRPIFYSTPTCETSTHIYLLGYLYSCTHCTPLQSSARAQQSPRRPRDAFESAFVPSGQSRSGEACSSLVKPRLARRLRAYGVAPVGCTRNAGWSAAEARSAAPQ
eukprot:874948-Rhodomonas_salina.1